MGPSSARVSDPETRTDARTQTGFVVYRRALSALTRMAAAAPSPMGAHISRVSGSATIGDARISSRLYRSRYWACGLRLPLKWFLTAMRANCSFVVPYFAMWFRAADA